LSFEADTALRPAGDGVYEGAVAEGWQTPRGPLGGYVMALILRGMTLAVGDPARAVRSLTVQFLRPPRIGAIAVLPRVERAGRSLSSVSARLEQDGDLIALALAAYSTPWESPLIDAAPMPEVEPPDESRPVVPEGAGPEFTQRLTMQGRFGDPPFSGSDRAEVGGWLGMAEARELDALSVALLADAWWPAPWPRLNELRPAPTIEMNVLFRAPLPLSETMLLGRFTTKLVRDGFFEEDGELWAPGGTLVAQSRQLALLMAPLG
jgi:Acyl-CoA thioesterase C-terminal domain/Acyl-CoA thioesterase N-terminal domain